MSSLLVSSTLQRTIFSVRNMLNQPNPNNSFWSDAELTHYINEGIRVYFAEVVQYGEGYFQTATNLDIAANVETVALPTDCFKVKALYKTQSGGYELIPYSANRLEGYSTSGGTSGSTYSGTYEFQGNNLLLRPIPNFSEVAGLRLEYVQFPSSLVDGGDTMTAGISPVFKQLVEMYAVYKAKLKETLVNNVTVHAAAKENLGELYQQFKDAIQDRAQYPRYIIPFNP